MKQYCRYCIYLNVNNFPYCSVKEKELAESSCKRPNNCKDFELACCESEYQDAFGENAKGYKPREKKEPVMKQCDGQILFGEGEIQ